MANPDTPKRNGYKPINTNPEDELKLHTDGEMPPGENENKYLQTEKSSIRRSKRNVCNRIYSGEYDIQKTSGYDK